MILNEKNREKNTWLYLFILKNRELRPYIYIYIYIYTYTHTYTYIKGDSLSTQIIHYSLIDLAKSIIFIFFNIVKWSNYPLD